MDDTKLYAIQDIERLKQKIAVYKETLTTLKKGTSIEDFLNRKEEFDGFKIQIAHLEGLTKTIDEKQSMQIEGYEEKVIQIANQIDLLNQTVEEMNQEISLLLIKEKKVEVNEPTVIRIKPCNEEPSLHAAEQPLPMPEEIPQVKEPFLLSNRPPSFIQLQKLAGLARNKKEDDIPENPIASNPNLANPSEERHFNQRYFQSINTHPSQMYNGLYKNITNTSSFHFKNESSVQNIAIYANEIDKNPADGLAGEINPSVVPIVGEVEKIVTAAEETNHSAVPIIDEIENIDTTTEEINHPAVPIIDEVESIDTTAEETNHSAVPIIDGIESTDTTAEVINHSAVPIIDGIESIDTTAEEIDDVSLESPIEEMTDQEEPLNEAAPVEHKKEGFSSFFNLFRRRN